MTQYTEDDLRTVFAEHSAREDGGAPLVSEIRRREVRTRLRRRMTAGSGAGGGHRCGRDPGPRRAPALGGNPGYRTASSTATAS